MLDALIENTRNKTKNQMKTLIQTILPCIALYKVLSDEILAEGKAHEYMRRYSASGPRTWKAKDGRTLKEIEDNATVD